MFTPPLLASSLCFAHAVKELLVKMVVAVRTCTLDVFAACLWECGAGAWGKGERTRFVGSRGVLRGATVWPSWKQEPWRRVRHGLAWARMLGRPVCASACPSGLAVSVLFIL